MDWLHTSFKFLPLWYVDYSIVLCTFFIFSIKNRTTFQDFIASDEVNVILLTPYLLYVSSSTYYILYITKITTTTWILIIHLPLLWAQSVHVTQQFCFLLLHGFFGPSLFGYWDNMADDMLDKDFVLFTQLDTSFLHLFFLSLLLSNTYSSQDGGTSFLHINSMPHITD